MAPLSGRVALVTGASRGIGRGIALQLGEAGATVYVTGRKPKDSDAVLSGNSGGTALPTLQQTAEEITARGGVGIALYCDHANENEIKELFEKIAVNTDNKLDILVNNAYSAVNMLFNNTNKKFWEVEPSVWDDVNNVGLRNHYICSVYAARLMVPSKSGLIVNVSSIGGLYYILSVAYSVGKTACDRMAADMAEELRPHGIAAVSLWPGAVRTELIEKRFEDDHTGTQPLPDNFTELDRLQWQEFSETIEFSGKAVVALALDRNVMGKSGRIVTASDLADEYGFVDIDGGAPLSLRTLKLPLQYTDHEALAAWIPSWIKLPGWLLTAAFSKL